jgi:hypothetical protein
MERSLVAAINAPTNVAVQIHQPFATLLANTSRSITCS